MSISVVLSETVTFFAIVELTVQTALQHRTHTSITYGMCITPHTSIQRITPAYKCTLSSLCESFPTSDVDESVPRDCAVFAVEVEVEQGTLPVTVIKLIANVPAQWTKLLSLLRHMQNKTQRRICEYVHMHTQANTYNRMQESKYRAHRTVMIEHV